MCEAVNIQQAQNTTSSVSLQVSQPPCGDLGISPSLNGWAHLPARGGTFAASAALQPATTVSDLAGGIRLMQMICRRCLSRPSRWRPIPGVTWVLQLDAMWLPVLADHIFIHTKK